MAWHHYLRRNLRRLGCQISSTQYIHTWQVLGSANSFARFLLKYSWWRHLMETFSALLARCAGNSPVTGEFPSQSPVTRSFDVSLICAWTNSWANNGNAGDLRRTLWRHSIGLTGHTWPRKWLNITAKSHNAMPSQITDNSTVCSTVFLADIKGNTEAQVYCITLSNVGRWIPLTKGQ